MLSSFRVVESLKKALYPFAYLPAQQRAVDTYHKNSRFSSPPDWSVSAHFICHGHEISVYQLIDDSIVHLRGYERVHPLLRRNSHPAFVAPPQSGQHASRMAHIHDEKGGFAVFDKTRFPPNPFNTFLPVRPPPFPSVTAAMASFGFVFATYPTGERLQEGAGQCFRGRGRAPHAPTGGREPPQGSRGYRAKCRQTVVRRGAYLMCCDIYGV